MSADKVASQLENSGHGSRIAREVERNTKSLLDLMRVEIACGPLGRERANDWRGDVKLVFTRVRKATPHIGEAEFVRSKTSPVYFRFVSPTLGVLLFSHAPANACEVPTHWRTLKCQLIGSLVNRLDAICVVYGKLGVFWHLGVNVDAGIDQPERVEFKLDGRSLDGPRID